MKNSKKKEKRAGSGGRLTVALAFGVAALLLISLVFLAVAYFRTSQSSEPSIAGVCFDGEYRIGEREWQPIRRGEHISSTRGDVYLRGVFMLTAPDTGEFLCPVGAGGTVSLYLNHLNATASCSSGGTDWISDSENESLGEDACAVTWGGYAIPYCFDAENCDLITIKLHNPHSFGNENAIDDFLKNMSIASGVYHDMLMLDRGAPERTVGMIISISSLIVLGIAAFSTVIHLPYSKELWIIGLLSFFAGGYFLFDAFAVSLWNSPNIVNTRALGLCMMFYMLLLTALAVMILKGRRKTVALAASIASGAVVLGCILISMLSPVKFYDTWIYWACFEIAVVALFAVCLIGEFRRSSLRHRLISALSALALLAFPLDLVATAFGWWEGGFISKRMFLVFFAVSLVITLRVIPSHINAAIKAKQLEAEQKALQLELQESRISIMLSQMQPHFIFNTLNTIYHLCEIDPDIARKTISSFSEYLRNNIDTLGQSEMINFEKELSFVKTYLDIEKVRFDDELEISFDIEVTNFKLPVLTVQPIVENAVKHGTSKKEGVAELIISTREREDCYEIIIRDTGVGFDPDAYGDDGHKHVGISNVRQRLENLCGGTLAIESELGGGTAATIKIPKKESDENEDNSCR